MLDYDLAALYEVPHKSAQSGCKTQCRHWEDRERIGFKRKEG